MASFTDPTLDHAAKLWSENGQQDQHLYPGSQDQIAEKLVAWVERVKWLYDRQMTMREKRFTVMEKLYEVEEGSAAERDMVAWKKLATEYNLIQKIVNDLDDQSKYESLRGHYLLASLRKRGFTWTSIDGLGPVEPDNQICAFLGSIDLNFNVVATYLELEAKERESKLKARSDELTQKRIAFEAA